MISTAQPVLPFRQPLFASSQFQPVTNLPSEFGTKSPAWPSAIRLKIYDNPKPNPEFIEQCKKALARFFSKQPAYLQACLLTAVPPLNFQLAQEGHHYVEKLEDARSAEELEAISKRSTLDLFNEIQRIQHFPELSLQEFKALDPPMTRKELDRRLLALTQQEHQRARAVFVPHLNQINLHEFNGEGYNITISFHPVADPERLQNTLRHECAHFINFKEFETFKRFEKSRDPFGLNSISNLKAFRKAVMTDIKGAFQNQVLPLRKTATGTYEMDVTKDVSVVRRFNISDPSYLYRFIPLTPEAWRYSFEEFCADVLATAAFGQGALFPANFIKTVFPNTLQFMQTVVLKRLQKKYTPSWLTRFLHTLSAWFQQTFKPSDRPQGL